MPTLLCSKDDFRAYCRLQVIGVVNMLDRDNVCRLTGLTPEKHKDIIQNYNEYRNTYPEVWNEYLGKI